MKWGLFGGTFDPVHFGHLRAAQELAGMLGLDRVIFIPAARPPHKTEQAVTAFAHRAQMVSLAIAGNGSFSFSDVENKRPGKSYSIDTVRFFSESQADTELYFITGQDAFDGIASWYQWEKLLSMCHFVVMARPGCSHGDISRGLHRLLPHAIPMMNKTICSGAAQESVFYFGKQLFWIFPPRLSARFYVGAARPDIFCLTG